jgi:hypothetical protein
MRSPQERNTRLENMSWRIWNLARKKKQVYDAYSVEIRMLPIALIVCILGT